MKLTHTINCSDVDVKEIHSIHCCFMVRQKHVLFLEHCWKHENFQRKFLARQAQLLIQSRHNNIQHVCSYLSVHSHLNTNCSCPQGERFTQMHCNSDYYSQLFINFSSIVTGQILLICLNALYAHIRKHKGGSGRNNHFLSPTTGPRKILIGKLLSISAQRQYRSYKARASVYLQDTLKKQALLLGYRLHSSQ